MVCKRKRKQKGGNVFEFIGDTWQLNKDIQSGKFQREQKKRKKELERRKRLEKRKKEKKGRR